MTAIHIVERMTEAVVRGDFDTALTFIAPDAVDHSPLPGAPPGHAGWRRKWERLVVGSPVRTTVAQRVAAGDTVATRYAVHDVDTGQPLGFGLDMLRVVDGRIVEHWGLPLPGPAAER